MAVLGHRSDELPGMVQFYRRALPRYGPLGRDGSPILQSLLENFIEENRKLEILNQDANTQAASRACGETQSSRKIKPKLEKYDLHACFAIVLPEISSKINSLRLTASGGHANIRL
jgi:hypothetical protein